MVQLETAVGAAIKSFEGAIGEYYCSLYNLDSEESSLNFVLSGKLITCIQLRIQSQSFKNLSIRFFFYMCKFLDPRQSYVDYQYNVKILDPPQFLC